MYPLPPGLPSVYQGRALNATLERELSLAYGTGPYLEPEVRDSVLRIRFRAETLELSPDSATRLAIAYVTQWRSGHPAQAAALARQHLAAMEEQRAREARQAAAAPPAGPPRGDTLAHHTSGRGRRR